MKSGPGAMSGWATIETDGSIHGRKRVGQNQCRRALKQRLSAPSIVREPQVGISACTFADSMRRGRVYAAVLVLTTETFTRYPSEARMRISRSVDT